MILSAQSRACSSPVSTGISLCSMPQKFATVVSLRSTTDLGEGDLGLATMGRARRGRRVPDEVDPWANECHGAETPPREPRRRRQEQPRIADGISQSRLGKRLRRHQSRNSPRLGHRTGKQRWKRRQPRR